ncbi:hypothetical protein KO498_15035 [Lentibacter algarum]|uniref:hypothetical protein n=1 Tax=Lentibacter algarum TaxID=576131 RepID=UPI001C0A29BC|nr:hypothetical protein [Lentibacter algarum]MBU2983124.1 hypothetical protein [Lentibacter algarum]
MRKILISFGLVAMLGACADPLADVAKISEVELQEEPAQADALAAPVDPNDTRPLFQRLMGKKAEPEAALESGVEQDAVNEAVEEAVAEGVVPELETAPESALKVEQADEKPKLFGFLKAKPDTASETAPVVAPATEGQTEGQTENQPEIVQASLAVEPAENPAVAATKQQRGGFKGMFSGRKAAVLTGPDAQIIEPGTSLGFGTIARVCGLKKSDMGAEVERSSDGKGKFRLYDSAPGSITSRAYYITGFDDGCPRQVNAALALFGDVEQHESLRYGDASKGQPWSETDKAYEKVKRQVCKTGKGKPCGAKLKSLEKSTSFVTVYNTFVGAQSWRNILLHDGSVVAMN